MKRLLAGTTAALLLGASAITTMGLHTSYAASTTKQLHNADALLWPYQSGNNNGGSGGGSNNNSTNVIWENSNVPGGSLAIVTGAGKNLNFILHAKYLRPGKSYTAFISQAACGGNGSTSGNGNAAGSGNGSSGNGGANNNSPLGNYQLGKVNASGDGSLTLAGKLDTKHLPPSFVNGPGSGNSGNGNNNGSGNNNGNGNGNGNSGRFSVHIVLSSMMSAKGTSNGGTNTLSYCGDIETPQAVIPLRSVKGNKATGIALVSRNVPVWWKSSNTLWGNGGGGNGATQVVVFAHNLPSSGVHQAQIDQGRCNGTSQGMVEYPLSALKTDGSGMGVAGTLLNTSINILNFPSAVNNGSSSNKANPPNSQQLSLTVLGKSFKPATCGNLPYSSNTHS